MTSIAELKEIKLHDLKEKSPTELLGIAEELEIENASALRRQELIYAILKSLAARDVSIIGEGVVEILQDGFGFLRSPDATSSSGGGGKAVAQDLDHAFADDACHRAPRDFSGSQK